MVVANAVNASRRRPTSCATARRRFDTFVSDESDDIALIALQGPTRAR